MFKEVARVKQRLTREECDEVLEKALRGVLAVNGDDEYPYALPIDFYYDASSQKIFFHSGKAGYKLDCIRRSDKASFAVTDDGERKAGVWWLTIKSVIAFGEIEEISDKQMIRDVSTKLSLKFTKDQAYIDKEITDYLDATLLLALNIRHLTGKCVREK